MLPHKKTPARKTRGRSWSVTDYRLQTEKRGVLFESAVVLLGQDGLCQNFSKLDAFLVKGVDVPQEALEHNLVLEVRQEGSQSFGGQALSVNQA